MQIERQLVRLLKKKQKMSPLLLIKERKYNNKFEQNWTFFFYW